MGEPMQIKINKAEEGWKPIPDPPRLKSTMSFGPNFLIPIPKSPRMPHLKGAKPPTSSNTTAETANPSVINIEGLKDTNEEKKQGEAHENATQVLSRLKRTDANLETYKGMKGSVSVQDMGSLKRRGTLLEKQKMIGDYLKISDKWIRTSLAKNGRFFFWEFGLE
jgi:hypothetical protein